MLEVDKGPKLALLEMRSHILWYLKGLPKSSPIKEQICSAQSKETVFEILDNYFTNLSFNDKASL